MRTNSGIRYPRRVQPSPSDNQPSSTNPTVYDRIGEVALTGFAESLYRRIESDPAIRSMFSADLSEGSDAVTDMREFLIQFFGGPAGYSTRKGHPRLRARHLRFTIGQAARDVWLSHALAALEEIAARHTIDAATVAEMRAYFAHASAFMINHSDESPPAR